MSKDIFETDRLQVTAFVGKNGTSWIQIGLKGNHTYEQLNEKDSLLLAHAILARFVGIDGYKATD